jgi:pilus assembly protein CpaB
MKKKIVMMLLLAVGGGTASLTVARSWLDGQANARLAAIEAQATDVRFDTIVVAAEPLRFGATLSTENLKTIPWPSGELPPGAFSDVDALLAAGPRRVLAPLEVSEPILPAKVTGAGEGAALSRLISEGQRAVSVRVDDVAGVAGFLLPGDRVDVVLTRDAGGTSKGEVILQGVKVLTIDQSADERAEGPQVARAVTVEVDPVGAQKIALARVVGSLSLTLRPAGDVSPASVPSITAADLAPGGAPAAVPEPADAVEEEKPVASAPPPPPPPPVAVVPQQDPGTTVWVSRALARTSYQVPSRETAEPLPAVAPAPVPAPARLIPPAPQAHLAAASEIAEATDVEGLVE